MKNGPDYTMHLHPAHDIEDVSTETSPEILWHGEDWEPILLYSRRWRMWDVYNAQVSFLP